MSVENKVVVVTGGSEGLGRACANELAQRGARVVVGDIIEPAEPVDGVFVRCDVSQASDCARLADEAVSVYGRLDALFNNAGVEGNGTVETCAEDDWDRVMAVNLKGMFLAAKYAIPHLRATGGGVILNMASVAGFWGEPGTVPYNAAKGGIIGLTRAMAMDHGPDGIRVNCLCPGYHSTGMPERFFADLPKPEAMREQVSTLMALRRMGEPEELARTVCFLLSDESTYMTGAAIVLDGGMTAGYPWHEAS